jgi:hypothetical protein
MIGWREGPMTVDILEGPPAAIVKFFASLDEDDRVWLTCICTYNMEDEYKVIKTTDDANEWLLKFLTDPKRFRVKCSRLIFLIAFLDFQLSPLMISRVSARASWMMLSKQELIAKEGQQMRDNFMPRLERLTYAWRDVRSNELDEASLWVFRDEAEDRDFREQSPRQRIA